MPKRPVTFELKGDKHMRARLARMTIRFPGAAAQALRLEAESVMTTSKRDFVPVDLGALKASGKVDDVEVTTAGMGVVLSYGDAASPYALAVHEHPSVHSPPTWQGKTINFRLGGDHGTKYLERPMMRAIRGMASRIASRINAMRGWQQ